MGSMTLRREGHRDYFKCMLISPDIAAKLFLFSFDAFEPGRVLSSIDATSMAPPLPPLSPPHHFYSNDDRLDYWLTPTVKYLKYLDIGQLLSSRHSSLEK